MAADETVTAQTVGTRPVVSVIVPARNEEVSLADCLQSLVAQQGVDFEIIVVDDHSTDRTREIAESFSEPSINILVIEADPLPAGWTGKNNAVTTGARVARGDWLLFTDADTVHLPGSLASALAEAQANSAEMLSYSPEQIAVTFWEMAILPVVFAELARQYPPSKVSDPNSPIAAANGQYILIKREAYDAVGGHAAIAGEILEDVALAHTVKQSGRKIRFRCAADAVRTRMYRNFAQLREGWTKNLALLFPRPDWLALGMAGYWSLMVLQLVFGVLMRLIFSGLIPAAGYEPILAFLLCFILLYARIAKANFPVRMTLLSSLFGAPIFAYLLLRSKRAHANGSVPWKGRTYSDPQSTPTSSNLQLRTGN